MLLFVLVDCWIIGDSEYQFSRIFWSWYIGVYYFRQLYSVVTLLIVHVHNSLVFFTLWIIGKINIIVPLIEQIITMSMIRISNYQKDILRLPFEKNHQQDKLLGHFQDYYWNIWKKKEIVEMPNINYLLTLYVSIFPLLVSI